MKRIFSNVKYVVPVLAMTLFACTKDVYEPDKPTPTPDPEKPVDGSLITNTPKTLTVNIVDAYDGKYYYTVEAFMGNPAIEENAKLIAGSGQKMNSKVPYSVAVSLPEIMKTLHIRVTDPFKRSAVYAFDVTEGDMVCDIGNATPSSKASYASLRSSETEFPEINYSYEGLAYTELSGSKAVTLDKGKVYVIKPGTTFSGSVTFPGEGNVSLYVAGTWEVDLGNSIQLETNTNIYVLSTGKVLKAKGNGKVSLVGTSRIAVRKDGTFGSGEDTFFLYLTNGTQIVNEGNVKCKEITMDSQSALYNKGVFEADKISIENDGNKILNARNFKVDILTLKNGSVYNNCVFQAATKLDVTANGKIILGPVSLMDVKHLSASGLTLTMDAKSMWVGDKAEFTGQASTIQGGRDDYALFSVVNVDAKGYKVLNYKNKIDIVSKSHSPNSDQYNPCYTQDSYVVFSQGQGFVEIEKDECNNNTGNHNPGEGSGDTDEEFEETATMPYVYMFEDNWPDVGDYDMNDLVMGVQINNIKAGNNTKGVKIIATLYAVGGTKQLGAAFQLDGVTPSVSPDAESGQSNAVVWLFKDAHQVIGSSQRIPVNTYSLELPYKVITKEFQFAPPVKNKTINASNFNLFVVTGDMEAAKRNEIHVAGFKGTNKAAVSPLCTDKYTSTKTGLMWALCMPQTDFASYPKEGVYIGNAYSGFDVWTQGSQTPSWYKVTTDNKDKVMMKQ